MKYLQPSLRLLILIGSLGSFASGWALLAHAGKPSSAEPAPAELAPLPTLAPLNFSNNQAPTGLQPLSPLPPVPQAQAPRMRLRTRSS